MSTAPNPSPRAVECPPSQGGCGAAVGASCTSHGGTRERHDFHRARTAAWETARIAAVPAAKVVADAVAERRVRSGTQAAALLAEHGHTTEAEAVRHSVLRNHGLMSAKQAVALLLDGAQGGEG